MKRITTLLLTTAFAAGAFLFVTPTTAQASHLSNSEQQRILTSFVMDLREINNAGLDSQTRSFLLQSLLEQLRQSLRNHDVNDRDDNPGDNDERDYRRARQAAEDYLEDEENEDDFDIERIERYRDGYRVYVELDNGDDVVIELDDDFDVEDYDREEDDDDDRNDNSDNPYADDDTRVYDNEIEFRLSFDLEADRRDIYIEDDIEEVLEFEIQDEDGDVVADENDLGDFDLSGDIRSSADREDGYFVIEEDEQEEFEFVITFEPNDDDEEYRLVLRELKFNDRPRPANDELRFRSDRYATDYYSID